MRYATEVKWDLCSAIRSHHEPLAVLREEREQAVRRAIELLMTLNELRTEVNMTGDLCAVLEWQQTCAGVEKFLANIGVPLRLAAPVPSVTVAASC